MQNPRPLSHSRISYTSMNPDKCLSSLCLKPSSKGILQPVQAMQFIAPLSLPWDWRNSQYALKTITSYLIHLNMNNRSFSSYLGQSFFEDLSQPPSTLPLLFFMLSDLSSNHNIIFSSLWVALHSLPDRFFFSWSTPLLKYSTHNFRFLSKSTNFINKPCS